MDSEGLHYYSTGPIMGCEYVTRAYQALYMAENTKANMAREFLYHKTRGFKYIKEVYEMVKGGDLH